MARTPRTIDDGIKWILFLLPWEAKVYEDISKEFLAREADHPGLLEGVVTIELRPALYNGLFGQDTYRETIRRFIEAGILVPVTTSEDQAVETYQLLIIPRHCLVEKISHRYLVHAPKAWAEEVAVIRDVFRSLAGTPLSLDEWLVKTFSCTKREAYRMQARYSNYQLEVECRQTRHLGILKGRHGGYLLNPPGLTFADVVSAEGGTRLRGKVMRMPWPEDVDKTFIGRVVMAAREHLPPLLGRANQATRLVALDLELEGPSLDEQLLDETLEIDHETRDEFNRLVSARKDLKQREIDLHQALEALPGEQEKVDEALRDLLKVNARFREAGAQLQDYFARHVPTQ